MSRSRILHILPSLDPGGLPAVLHLLASAAPSTDLRQELVITRGSSAQISNGNPHDSWSQFLAKVGLPVRFLGWNRLVDVRPFFQIREVASTFRPDVVHAWGPKAYWLGVAAARQADGSLAVSRTELADDSSAWDRWALRYADALLAQGPAEMDYWQRMVSRPERIQRVAPAYIPDEPHLEEPDLRAGLGLKTSDRVIISAGPLDGDRGIQDAIWACDILSYVYPDLHLVIVGDGPDRVRLQEFAKNIRAEHRVHLVGSRPLTPSWLAAAEVIWVPQRHGGGTSLALTGMAAGRPIVAVKQRDLLEIAPEGAFGYSFSAGDRATLARLTRRLLDDAPLREQLGAAGQALARSRFAPQSLIAELADLYGRLAKKKR